MASSEPKNPKVLVAPSTPIWFLGLKWAFVGLFLAFLAAFALVLRSHLRAIPLADAFRQIAVPLLQHRLEQRDWHPAFVLASPPETIARYGLGAVLDKALPPVEVPGKWSFIVEGEGATRAGVILFVPADAADVTTLRSVDQRLDDGRPESGKFRRRSDGSWGFSLSVD